MITSVAGSQIFRRWSRIAALAAGALVLIVSCSAGSTTGPSSSVSDVVASTARVDSTAQAGSDHSGPSGSSTEPAGASDALSVGFVLEPTSLDFTQVGGAAIPQVLLSNIYETLVKLDQQSHIVPGLASAYQVSPDRKTYTFTLRSGVTFTNGAPFTAADAKFSLDRVTTAWAVEGITASMKVVASTAAVSPTELTVTLKQPSNSWLFAMTGRIGAMFSRTGVAALATTPVGTGPFQLQAWNRGDSIVLARNPRYWGPAPAAGQVTFKYFKDGTAMDNALLTGGIQVVSTEQSPESLSQFKNSK